MAAYLRRVEKLNKGLSSVIDNLPITFSAQEVSEYLNSIRSIGGEYLLDVMPKSKHKIRFSFVFLDLCLNNLQAYLRDYQEKGLRVSKKLLKEIETTKLLLRKVTS